VQSIIVTQKRGLEISFKRVFAKDTPFRGRADTKNTKKRDRLRRKEGPWKAGGALERVGGGGVRGEKNRGLIKKTLHYMEGEELLIVRENCVWSTGKKIAEGMWRSRAG